MRINKRIAGKFRYKSATKKIVQRICAYLKKIYSNYGKKITI